MNVFTYIYVDPETGEPFYVGKGKGTRHLIHIKSAVKKRTGSLEPLCVVECRRLLNKNLMPTIIKVLETEIEAEAFLEEERLIRLYKRREEGGLLCNKTNGGEGTSGFKQTPDHIAQRVSKQLGRKRTLEQRERMKGPRASEKYSLAAIARSNTLEAKLRVSEQFKGKSIPEERKQRISATMKARGIKPVRKLVDTST